MTGLEILDRVAFGRTLFHRDFDAWDLLDETGLVAAVLCPRKQHLSISVPSGERLQPARVGKRIPYGERVEWKITSDKIEDGIEIVRRLVAS
jgi:hypothetical protein